MKDCGDRILFSSLIILAVVLISTAGAREVQSITVTDGGNTTKAMFPGFIDVISPVSSGSSGTDQVRSESLMKTDGITSPDSSSEPRLGIELANVLGASYSEEFASIHSTDDGGYIACGLTDAYFANGDVSVPRFIGNGDMWVVKLDASGNPTWQNVYGGDKRDECRSIRQTSDGGYVMAGFSNSVTGEFAGKNNGEYDIYVVKADSSGNKVWQQLLGEANTDVGTSIRQTNNGGYILTGFEDFSHSGKICQFTESSNAWVMRLNPDGTLQWKKKLVGNQGSHGTSIIEARDGNYLMYGFTSSSSGDGISGNHGSNDLWVVKMDPTGAILWSRLYGGAGFEITSHVTDDGIQQTTDNGFVLVGQTTSYRSGDVVTNHGAGDIWVLKLNETGDINWTKTFGGSDYDMASGGIHQTPDDGYVFAGMTQSSNSGDVSENHGGWDYWVAKTDKSGNLLWQDVLGGNKTEQCESIEPTPDGGYIVSGWTDSSQSGDVGDNSGQSDAWVVKMTPRYVVRIMDSDTWSFIPNGTVGMFDYTNNQSMNVSVSKSPAVFTDSPGIFPFNLITNRDYRLSINATGYPQFATDITYLLTNQSVDVWLIPSNRPLIGKTFSITNAWVKPQENPPFESYFDSEKYIKNLNQELKNDGWIQAFSEINGTNIKKNQFGVNPSMSDRTINDATLHWHIGHGTGKLNGTHTSLALPKIYNSSTSDFDYDFLSPSDVSIKWAGNNKWAVILSCWILQDPDWGNVLGTSHGIFGFTTPTDVKSELPSKFLHYARSGNTLYDSWYSATNDLYNNDVVGTEFINGPNGKARVDNYNHTVNVSAALRFKTKEQLNNDHLPGVGKEIAPDGDPNNSSSIGVAWDCHTGDWVYS